MQIEMSIKGLMVDPVTNMPIVILRDQAGQKVLPIWVGMFEANAIALVVCDLQDNTFYALIYLSLGGDTVAIDARPSDAIALALRTRAPIFVEEAVIENAKTVDFSAEKTDDDRLHKWLESLDPDDLGYKM
jgi:bifunctional DNase/RNase